MTALFDKEEFIPKIKDAINMTESMVDLLLEITGTPYMPESLGQAVVLFEIDLGRTRDDLEEILERVKNAD